MSRDHSDGSGKKSVFKAVLHHSVDGGFKEIFGQKTANERGKQGAQVDAHVKDRKRCIAPFVLFAVKFAQEGGDIGFKETVPQDDQRQSEIQRRLTLVDKQNQVSERHGDTTDGDGQAFSDEMVGQPATGKRCEITSAGVKAVNHRCGRRIKSQTAADQTGG